MLSKIRCYICALYLALGPISWMPSINVSIIKRVLLLLLVVLFLDRLFNVSKYAYLLFVFVLISLGLSIYFNQGILWFEYMPILLGVIENFILFVIGYNAFKLCYFDKKFYSIIFVIMFIPCLITIVNYLTDFPIWYAPSQYEIEANLSTNVLYEKAQLYQTGFSWGRNGWGTTVALYLPLFLLLYYQKFGGAIVGYIVLFLSIFISGTRNGVIAAFIPLCVYIYYYNKIHNNSFIKPFAIYAFIFILVIMNFSSISEFMRLESSDVTSGRMDQYALVPQMLSDMGFWGLGLNGTQHYIYRAVGEVHSLHNTFLNYLIEFGFLIGGVVLYLIYLSLKYVFRSLRSNDIKTLSWGLILLAGVLTTLFEPRMVFGNLGGCCLWWFAFGYLKANFCQR